MRAVFLGTPVEAIPALEAVHAMAEVTAVVTRPDRPRGRSRHPSPSPIKEAATALGLPVSQPDTRAELQRLVEDHRPQVGVVVAFGMILSPSVLAIPDSGFVNVHFSLLPRWRGAAPVERAVMEGDIETGVTVMLMDEGLDTGPILSQMPTAIHPAETGGSLRGRLAEMGAGLLGEVIPAWIAGDIRPRPQPDVGASYAHRITAEDRILSPAMTASRFVDTIRALSPRPGARLDVGGQMHKVLSAVVDQPGVPPGGWVERRGAPIFGVADGAVEILEIQPPGKTPMSGAEWIRGRPLPS